MVAERIPAEPVPFFAILGKPLYFNSGAVAKNRFLKAALTEKLSSFVPDVLTEHGIPSERIINLYTKWGKGGFGIVLTGNIAVDPLHLEAAGNVIVCDENDTPKLRNQLKRYSEAIKSEGSLAIAQITHAGRQTPFSVNPNPRSSSDIHLKNSSIPGCAFGKPTPYTEQEIKPLVIDRFVKTAKVLFETGFDGVQLHGAHGYLLAQFISLTTNKRTDKYGGTPENRIRIVLEIFDAIRAEIPASTGFAIGLKMNSVEFQEHGLDIQDARKMCELIEAQKFDFVELSGGNYEKFGFEHSRESTKTREAFFLDFSDQIRPAFKNTKVYVTGGFRTAKWMAKVIAEGNCDGVGLGRPITAEPDLPKKILQGQVLSAPDTKIDQYSFLLTAAASNTQMWQAGAQPLSQVEQLTDGIIDLSDSNKAQAYNIALLKYFADSTQAASEKPVISVFKYTEA